MKYGDIEVREVPGHPRYYVTNDGRVRGIKGWLKPTKQKPGGYMRFNSWNDKKLRSCLVHRAVALAYIGPQPTPQHVVTHLDQDHANNHVDNLRWATPSESNTIRRSRANG